MTGDGFAVGAALPYDFELAATPTTFDVLVEGLFGAASPGGELRHWFIHVEDRKAPPPALLDLRKLVRLVARGRSGDGRVNAIGSNQLFHGQVPINALTGQVEY